MALILSHGRCLSLVYCIFCCVQTYGEITPILIFSLGSLCVHKSFDSVLVLNRQLFFAVLRLFFFVSLSVCLNISSCNLVKCYSCAHIISQQQKFITCAICNNCFHLRSE